MQRTRHLVAKYPAAFGYGLVGILWALAFTAWVQHTPHAFNEPSAYDIFPLFGLMAFSALLSSYVVNAVATYLHLPSSKLTSYYQIVGYVILVLILSHPTALVTRLWMDGYGLPPDSYSAYVNKRYIWVVYLGVTSLFIFLAYELHRWFRKKNWWKWVIYANDVAMFLILFHGMTLGTELQRGWFRYVWWLYGVILLVSVSYLRYFAKRANDSSPQR